MGFEGTRRKVRPCLWTIVAVTLLGVSCATTETREDERLLPGESYDTAGTVSVEKTFWNLLFLSSAESRNDELFSQAEDQTDALHGPDAVMANVVLERRWSPLSLLLGLNALGFVELGSVRADVLLPVPSPPEEQPEEPEPPVPRITVSYPILPQERYEDRHGYIALEYRTAEDVRRSVKERLDKRGASESDYSAHYERIPEGGNLVLHIGRQDLMHANTRWYSYVVSSGDTVLMARRGEEGIPNIRGRDGNWWNVIELPLDRPVEDAVQVQVTDTKTTIRYVFEVTRLEEVSEGALREP